MRIPIVLLAAATCLNLAQAAPLPSDGTAVAPNTAHRAILQKFRTDQRAGLTTGNPDRITGYYAEHVRQMPAFQKTVMGKTNATLYHRAFAARFVVTRYDREEIQALDLGSRVVELGRFKLKLAVRASGREHDIAGKYLDIWEKLPDGGLALNTAAWNYDHDVEITDALRFNDVPAVQVALQARLPIRDRISFEVAALNLLCETAITQHDAKVWSLSYADDVILLANLHPGVQGRAAVDAYIEDHVQHLPVFEKLDMRNDRIEVTGRYVIECASHVANWRNGESSGVNTGKNIRIWRREPDGALRIFLAIGMYD